MQAIVNGCDAGNSPVDFVRYGPASNPLQFTATGCSVSGSGAYVTCLSGPGYGAGPFTYWLSLSGQVSAPLWSVCPPILSYCDFVSMLQNTSIANVLGSGYGAPVISSVSGPFAINADTRGAPLGNGVIISGLNFGATFMAGTQIYYTLSLSTPSVDTGAVPFGGNLTFYPTCNMSTPHYAFMCSVPPGKPSASLF